MSGGNWLEKILPSVRKDDNDGRRANVPEHDGISEDHHSCAVFLQYLLYSEDSIGIKETFIRKNMVVIFHILKLK